MNEEVNVEVNKEPVIKKKLELDIDVTPQNLGDKLPKAWLQVGQSV